MKQVPILQKGNNLAKRCVFLVLSTCFLLLETVEGASAKSKVLLVSMDGFRHDYLSKTDTPNIDAMISSGVTMPYVNNSFITDTFPSHYTIATGLFTESHGIVANIMYDPVFNSSFSKANRQPRWWEGGEPIWITATKAGLKVGVYFWPGSEVLIHGVHPAIWHDYDETVPFEDRVKAAVTWLSRNDFDLVVMYFDEPDSSGHRWGPDHPQMTSVIARMDRLLGFLVEEMREASLSDKVNFILTSDHGMTTIDLTAKVVDVTNYVDNSLLHTVVTQGSTAQMIPQPGKARALVQALSDIEHIHVMLKEDIPERFHLKKSRRVMDVFAYADEGWIITTNATYARSWGIQGGHGYDNTLPSMKPFFVATGPAFKQDATVEPIQNVDIYPLICFLLGIEPSANNGSLTRAQSLLAAESVRDTGATTSWSSVFTIISVITCVYISSAV